MKILSLALLGACGWIGTASPAHADDVSFDVGLGFRDGRLRGVAFGVEVGPVGRPVRAPRGPIVVDPIRPRASHVVAPFRPYGPGVVVAPVRPVRPIRPIRPVGPVGPGIVVDPVFPAFPDPGHGHDSHCVCDRTYIPAHTVCREETVCVPAVYEDRCVPVYETRCVPVYETVCVPVTDWVIDPRTGRRHEVVVGERKESVQVGERHETVKVGERHERVLVQAETTRVVTHHDTVPGRWVTVCDGRHAGGHAGEVLSPEAYRLEVAALDSAPRGGFAPAGTDRFSPRGAGHGARHDDDDDDHDDDRGGRWYTGDRR